MASILGARVPGHASTKADPAAQAAVVSAMTAVKKAIPAARLVEVSPDYMQINLAKESNLIQGEVRREVRDPVA